MIQFHAERFHQRVLSSPAYRLPPDRGRVTRLHSTADPGDGFLIHTQPTHFYSIQ